MKSLTEKIVIQQGDLTEMDTDAIVNAANNDLVLGTGIAGFPLKDCAEIMLREAAQHLRGETSLETVYFVLFDEAAQGIFERAWRKIQAEPAADSAGAKGA